MAERISSTLAATLRKRRKSTGSNATLTKQLRISTRSPTTTPRHRFVRMSVVASPYVLAAAGATPVAEAAASSKQSTPLASEQKSAQSSDSSSSSARQRRPNQTLQMLSESLGKLPSTSKQPAGKETTGEGDTEPGSEAAAVSPQHSSRQLQFTDSGEETASDTQSNEVSQDSDYVPERAEDPSQDDESENNDRNEADSDAAGVVLPDGMKARRRTKFWEPEEEQFLREGVQKHGMGKWKLILIEGRGVLSSHRTNVDLKDKWKNLQLRGGEPPREKRKAPATPAAATEPAEINISDNEGSTASPAPPPPPREPKKRRTAAVVASASFAAVRTAELSPSQSQSPSQNESQEQERYQSERFQSPQVDNPYKAEEVVEESEREEDERGTPEPKSKVSSAVSQETETPASVQQTLEAKPGSKAPAPKAKAAAPKAKTPVSKSKAHAAAKAKAPAPKTKSSQSKPEPRTTVSDFVEFEFASDKTFPEKVPMQVNLKQCRTIGMLKDRVRKYLFRDIPESVPIQLAGVSSRRLVDDDEDTERCYQEFGHDYYLLY